MNKNLTPMVLFRCSTLLLVFSLALTGCAVVQIRRDANTLQESTVLVGIVSTPLPRQNMRVVVAAYSESDRERAIAHYTTLHEPGPYELIVPKGVHNIVAFGDKNKNLIYDDGEPAGEILSAEQASRPAGGVLGDLDVIITTEHSDNIDLPIGSKIPKKGYKGFHSTCPGAIAKMEDHVFSDEYGKKGYWAGLEFFKEIGGNVYFLEPYDPEKIPILFVHGAAGSPQNWRTFFESIDRDKYQPWFFYYPSGSQIDSMSYLLLWKLQNLQAKYKFKELCITAHSLGGLVVRSFIINYGHLFPSVTSFISISTPWGGEELAELGVKYSPGVIPAWRDMQPESEFISSIFRKPIPPSVDYYLFFGHKGNRNILRPNNDNGVTLASQLDQRSQKDAKMIYGFNEDHVSILSSKQVISQYNSILADIYQESEASDAIAGNRLLVDFSFDFPKNLPRPQTALYLRSIDKEGSDSWIYLSPENTGREHGPFPSGKYEASIIAPAFMPEPVSIPISIDDGLVQRVQFSMKPVGFIRGYVAEIEQPYMQAGKDRQPDTEIELQSITLKGDGIHRTLTPPQEQKISHFKIYPAHYLSETDFTAQGAFFFFDLPAGKYTLTIKAKGYEPYSEICDVQPGQYQDKIVIKLDKTETIKDSP